MVNKKILLLHKKGWSYRKISGEVDRSICVISNLIKDPMGYGSRKMGGKTSTVSDSMKRRIWRMAKTGQKSASDIKADTGVQIGVRQVQKIIKQCPDLVYAKRKKAPRLTAKHMKHRYDWAYKHIQQSTNWTKIIFSDEKRFSLDGPDQWSYYWHDLRKEPELFQTRQSGGGGLMVWGAFSAKGLTELHICEGSINSSYYCKILEDNLLPYIKEKFKRQYTFQQDNAPVHCSNMTKKFIKDHNVKVMEWPSKSPDLNPMENLWGILAQSVYKAGKKQFDTKIQLKRAILKAWHQIDLKMCTKLVEGMPTHCAEVVSKHGRPIDY